ncbi:hypothetical protein COLO4_00852 [Corchorus olitorius]|uniref:Uncharacterized protein n=1 Tax=Corchorus olitorius TaxID=93759 RepID=A0A1R3L394_9ROSI|nr:hypothetical protein COLO4_00852 [Corchorus olitorius]
MARSSLSRFMPSGRNSGSITDDRKSTVISGMPRQNSIMVTEMTLIAGSFERRPRASRMPSGSAPTMPTAAMTMVSIRPPHSLVGHHSQAQTTVQQPERPPAGRSPAGTGRSEPCA